MNSGFVVENERQTRHVVRLKPGRNIVQGPAVRWEGRQPRRRLMRPWLDAERRFQYGHYYRLMEENCDWKTGTPWMEPAMFDELLHKIRPRLAK